MLEIIMLILAGFAAGAINAVAGGGMLIVFPLLCAVGVPPITANITCNLVLFPGAAASVWGYRRELRHIPLRYYMLLIPCYIGAAVGAVLLARTTAAQFELLMPWLLLVAVAFFIAQPQLSKLMAVAQHRHLRLSYAAVIVLLAVTAVYGGYFGAGFGFLFMGVLGLMGLKSMTHFAALKNLAGGGIELCALLYFMVFSTIAWEQGIPAMIGCFAGGLMTSRLALRASEKFLRTTVAAIGCTLVVVSFITGQR